MNRKKAFIAPILAIIGFCMLMAAVYARDGSNDRREVKINVKKDTGNLSKDLECTLDKLEFLRGLKVRVRGPRDFRMDLDLSGLDAKLRNLERLGERFDHRTSARLTRSERRKLRRALRKLRDLDIDLDFDFDFDIDIN